MPSPPSAPAQPSDRKPPPCSFSQFLVSLGSSAMVHLGEAQDPDGGAHKDLALAAHTLNLLSLLRAKTRGNLDADEARLLDALVDELGQKYEAVAGHPVPNTCS